MSLVRLLAAASALTLFSGARYSARKGEHDFRAGHFGDAAKKFEESVRRDPSELTWRYDLGTARAAAGQAQRARPELEAAAASQDTALAAASLYQLGTLDLGLGSYAKAAASLQKSLELDPARRDAKRNLEIAVRALQQQPPPKKEAGAKPPPDRNSAAEKEFEKKAGMSRQEAEALLRSLDAEQKRTEKAKIHPEGKDW